MEDHSPRFGLGNRIALVAIFVGAMGAIAAMALPLAYPDALSLFGWRVIFWTGVLAFIAGIFFLAFDLLRPWQVATFILQVLLILVAGVVFMYFFAEMPLWARCLLGALLGASVFGAVPAIMAQTQAPNPIEAPLSPSYRPNKDAAPRHTTGILNNGKGTTMEGNHLYGQDVGIDNRGEGAKINNNDIK